MMGRRMGGVHGAFCPFSIGRTGAGRARAKAGNQKQVKKASAAWYRNGNQIAAFLSEANPDNWPRDEMRAMLRMHLDQTLAEATQHLEGDHEADVRTYDEIHVHILEIADALSDGIVAQFPEQFE